jgi:hypothetical protein
MPTLTILATAALRTPSPSVQDTYFNTCSENHIVGDINLLQDVRPIIMQLEWGEEHLINVEGIGTRILRTAVGEATNTITVADVFYVPGFINILSYMRMRDKGIFFEDNGKQAKLRCNKDIVAYVNMPGKDEKGLPTLLLRPSTSSSYVTYTTPTAANEVIWHRRYGHINIDYVKKASNVVKGMPITKKGHLTSCHSCLTAK